MLSMAVMHGPGHAAVGAKYGGVTYPTPTHPMFIGFHFTPSNEKNCALLFNTLLSRHPVCSLHFFALEIEIFVYQVVCAEWSRDPPAHSINRSFHPLHEELSAYDRCQSIQLAKLN